jgi:hypothetical protein
MAAAFRVEHRAQVPAGWKVRTKLSGTHRVRIAFPPGARRRGSGKVVEILHPKVESNPCPNPLGAEELIIFGNPARHVRGRGNPAKGKPAGHKAGCRCPICKRGANPRAKASPLAKARGRRAVIRRQLAKLGQRLDGTESLKQLRELRRKAAGNPRRRRNQAGETDQAVRLFQTFHGRDPKSILEKQRSAAMRADYTALGDLEYLIVKAPHGKLEKINFSGDGVKLASSAGGAQLYAIGGNQNLNDCLKQFTDDTSKDIYDLGEVHEVQYLARKSMAKFEPVSYYHKFGEETGARPRLGYDALKKEIFFAGGEYRIEAPGIIN